jgi:hypothetical protein
VALKFSEIVRRASLNTYTSQHVLKRVGEALGLPIAGRQGEHREFSLYQAVRFAVAVKLSMGGVNVRHLPALLELCERRVWSGRKSPPPDLPLYQQDPKRPWCLEIIEDDLVQVQRSQGPRHLDHHDPAAHYSLAAGKIMSDFDHPAMIRQGGRAISTHRIDLTWLERQLQDP